MLPITAKMYFRFFLRYYFHPSSFSSIAFQSFPPFSSTHFWNTILIWVLFHARLLSSPTLVASRLFPSDTFRFGLLLCRKGTKIWWWKNCEIIFLSTFPHFSVVLLMISLLCFSMYKCVLGLSDSNSHPPFSRLFLTMSILDMVIVVAQDINEREKRINKYISVPIFICALHLLHGKR